MKYCERLKMGFEYSQWGLDSNCKWQCECSRTVAQHIQNWMKSCFIIYFFFCFTLLLINGLVLVAYLKIIYCSEMPYNIMHQNIRAVFNYKVRTTWTQILENTKDSQEQKDANFFYDFVLRRFLFLCYNSQLCFDYWWRYLMVPW